MNPLDCYCATQATLLPFHQGRFACYSQDGQLIKEAMLYRNFCMVFQQADLVSATITEYSPVIFAGFLFKQYGHFLLESLARLWYAKAHPHLPICWVGRDGAILDFQEEILHLLGIKNTILFVDQPVRFTELHIPAPGYIIRNHFTHAHAHFLGQGHAEKTIANKKIYLSRKKFGGESCLSNEDEVESALKDQGFSIYYPEEHSVHEQISHLSSADVILAVEGSALHTLILLEHVTANVVIIPRPNTESNANFHTIAIAKNFKQTYLPEKHLYSEIIPISNTHIKYQGTINITQLQNLVHGDCFSPYALFAKWFTEAPEYTLSSQLQTDQLLNKLQKENKELKGHLKSLFFEHQKLLSALNHNK